MNNNNPETFDDGLTRVAPKGQFKAMNWWDMKEKELNEQDKTFPLKYPHSLFKKCRHQHEKELANQKLDLQQEFGKELAKCYKEMAGMIKLDNVLKLVSDWRDVSIRDPHSNIALMITNGGYIHKWTLIEKIKELAIEDCIKEATK